ncbi:MAG: hypothetical protein MJ245_04695 [Clostridia bacterium]|nr:hypothetical protein [Clostridia bacterium]
MSSAKEIFETSKKKIRDVSEQMLKNANILYSRGYIKPCMISEFDQDNLLDENFEAFERYIQKMYHAYNCGKEVTYDEVTLDLTPEEIALLEDYDPVEIVSCNCTCVRIYDSKRVKAIYRTSEFALEVDKKRVVDLMCKYDNFVSYLSSWAFSNEYIDMTENFCSFLSSNFDTSYLDERVFKIHPLLYRIVVSVPQSFFKCDGKVLPNLNEYFDVLFETSKKIEDVTNEIYAPLNVFETVS